MFVDWVFESVAAIAGVKPVPLPELVALVFNNEGSNAPLPGTPGFDILTFPVQVSTFLFSDRKQRKEDECGS